MVSNKVLYWDLLRISHDHLDVEERVVSSRTPGGFANRRRAQLTQGLNNFKKGHSMVVVLHVLVRVPEL